MLFPAHGVANDRSRSAGLALGVLVTIASACTSADGMPAGDGPSPPVAAGVIEGFYGPPWSHRDRLDMLRFMGAVGLTAYVYAPKDDPYHRERWREPYPPAELARLRELADSARAAGVAFHFAISPGGSMVYSDSGDYGVLLAKLTAVRNLGVVHFALFVDDVPPSLEHAADRAAFASLADAHAAVATRLHGDLAALDATLSVTPTTYTNAWGDREYLRRLGDLLPGGVPIFWTGADVASPEITLAQAEEWAALASQPVYLWDNYPVNDYARWRLFLGAYRGREVRLGDAVRAVFANPMNEAHASMLPLATLAAWARDPDGYDPDAALHDGIVQTFGVDAVEPLAPFLAAYGDYGWDHTLFESLFLPGTPIPADSIRGALRAMREGLGRLTALGAERPAVAALALELRPFVSQTETRLAALSRDANYRQADGTLVFAGDDAVHATDAAGPIVVDGSAGEWNATARRELRGPGNAAPTMAFAASGDTLYALLRVPFPPTRVLAGDRVPQGDHAAIVLQSDTGRRTTLSADDLIVLITPPTTDSRGGFRALSLPVTGFMAKWLGDNERMRFSEFLLSTLGVEPAGDAARAAGIRSASRATPAGYDVELAVPLKGASAVRLTVTVNATVAGRGIRFALPIRDFPANPATFATVTVEN